MSICFTLMSSISEIAYEIQDCEFDFFNEVKQMKSGSSAATTATSAVDTTPRCLITDTPLRKDHVTLRCGHKFNYIPLFKEVLFQKCSLMPKNIPASIITMYAKNTSIIAPSSLPVYASSAASSAASSTASTANPNLISVNYNSSYNLETTKLLYNEMKCPYCRTITPNILPYYPYPDVCKVKYVNTPPQFSLPAVCCEYGANTTSTTGDEHVKCKTACIYHEKYDMMLCNKHLNKLETTMSLKGSKSKSRVSATDATDATDANIIVSHHNPATTGCSFLLLSGPRKGSVCGKPTWIPKTTKDAEGAPKNQPQNMNCKAHWGK